MVGEGPAIQVGGEGHDTATSAAYGHGAGIQPAATDEREFGLGQRLLST